MAAVREFYEHNAQALFTYALALTSCRVAAEDAVHDAVCRILGRPALPAELRPYAFKCVRNAAVDAQRRARASEPIGILEPEACVTGDQSVLYRQVEISARTPA